MKKAVTFLLTLFMMFLNVQHLEAQLAKQNYADATTYSFFDKETSLFKDDAKTEETYSIASFEEESLSKNENNNVLTPITNANIKTAVIAWAANPTTATATYGHIKDWDVSNVTSMFELFHLFHKYYPLRNFYETSEVE